MAGHAPGIARRFIEFSAITVFKQGPLRNGEGGAAQAPHQMNKGWPRGWGQGLTRKRVRPVAASQAVMRRKAEGTRGSPTGSRVVR
jgi:hypothetical protein